MARNYKLNAETRERFGKNEMNRLRSEGRVPAVVYGPNEETIPLSLDKQEVSRLLQEVSFENTIIQLDISGKVQKSYQTLIREVQHHPYRPVLQHLDFYSVPEGRAIVVEIPIILHGNPIGVRNQGGLVQHILRDLEISVLPTKIPEHIILDITGLNIHDSIHVSDIPAGDFQVLTDPKRTVVSVVPPVIQKEAVPAEGVVGEGVEGAVAPGEEATPEPEVISRKKESEEE
ncbi:MAG: hypothetical protein A3F83_05025 [Candidatus Glassbacteria bacterium RIFCSPLOWO2_12_FULL_58_11]|uniref:Large ribosomal subunit protein bL25 n=2 Tax=Candidatus Glassiibacteriota TaxID=1817805 RepID=A0A1F5Z0R4_9BACT|nr:MAG: hypothetical protein A2Z86_12120 [Candidatus Glassbacteria bacterium GWA2_58_10]OGG05933.1 MAG: hypothetical protein A3F83_05025 [Candidatus Glassbacteria bacterium RIFCSPLOWO2_12_FULL_58_11]